MILPPNGIAELDFALPVILFPVTMSKITKKEVGFAPLKKWPMTMPLHHSLIRVIRGQTHYFIFERSELSSARILSRPVFSMGGE